MIDELVKAANAMHDAGISVQDWHPGLKTLPKVTPKAPCIRIWLDNEGHIHDLEPLDNVHVEQLRKYEPDNGKSFPGFNLRPLYIQTLPQKDAQKTVKELEENIKAKTVDWTEVLAQAEDLWAKDTVNVLNRIFSHISKTLENICLEGGLESGETLTRLFHVTGKMNVTQFQKEYCEKVQEKISNGELPLSLLLFWGSPGKEGKFSVFLDIKNYNSYPVAHVKTIERLNALMNHEMATKMPSVKGGVFDAYGLDSSSMEEKFPQVTLPDLGIVKLRSQVKVIRAQLRYDCCEAQTFHVGPESRKRTKGALEWLSDRKRDGYTYGTAGDQELLFAYPSILPDKIIPMAKMFGAQNDDSYQKEDSFEQLAATVVGQLKGFGKQRSDGQLEIFSLRKMDKARTKVVYYRNTTVASLEQSSANWQVGCGNIPKLDLRGWSETKDEKTGKSQTIIIEGRTVFPIKLHRYLNMVWKNDGQRADTGKSKVKTFVPSDGLRLLLDTPNQALAAHMLSHCMKQAQGYFLTLCRGTGRNEITSLKYKEYYPGILGLLLFYLGNKKEEFMKESAFLLGRCLRVTDEIHRLYCEIVRKKEVPPELCGSSLLISMMESPATTLSQLAMRSAPYVKWARTCNDKEKGGLVYYWMKQWSAIADQLHVLEWPKRMTPEERAQVFLGYLASFSKGEKTVIADEINSENIRREGDSR